MHEQERTLYTYHQNVITNDQWYEKFNTQSTDANGIVVARQHKVLLEHADQEKHSDDFEKITGEEQTTVRVDTEERYLAYVLLQKNGIQNVKLKSDIHNYYTTGDDRYPKTRQNTLHLLTQYTKPTIPRNSEYQGNSFVQRIGDKRNLQTYDKNYWKDKE